MFYPSITNNFLVLFISLAFPVLDAASPKNPTIMQQAAAVIKMVMDDNLKNAESAQLPEQPLTTTVPSLNNNTSVPTQAVDQKKVDPKKKQLPTPERFTFSRTDIQRSAARDLYKKLYGSFDVLPVTNLKLIKNLADKDVLNQHITEKRLLSDDFSPPPSPAAPPPKG